MFDAKKLLDQFMGGAPGGQGGGPAAGVGGGGGGFLDQVQGYARNNPLLTGGVAGGLAGLLLGSKFGRSIAGDAVKYGGMAVLGGLAYKAYRDWQATKGEAAPVPAEAGADGATAILPAPADSAFSPANAPQGGTKLAETLVIAMISAAKADGHIDAEERGRIYERLEQDGLDQEEVAFMRRELQAPIDIDRIARGVGSMEEAVEIYAASLMAIRADTDAEKDYLKVLASRLGIDPGLAASVEQTIAEASAKAPA